MPSTLRLSDVSNTRDNNFNLIRLIAALAVLYSHSFVIVAGSRATEPFMTRLGMTAGGVAVDVFFATSGLLVTSSLLSRRNVLAFARLRILRIYPALFVVCGFMIFVGMAFTTLPASSYARQSETLAFFLRNITMVSGAAFTLPGVFETVPFPRNINASLWTLPVEIGLYATLATIWICLGLAGKRERISVAVASMAALLLALHFARYFSGSPGGTTVRLCFMFFSGASLYVFRVRIVLSRWYCPSH